MNHQDNSEFIIGRIDLWNKIKTLKPVINKIVQEGVETDEEAQIARGVCSFVLAEMEYEDSPESQTQRMAGNN